MKQILILAGLCMATSLLAQGPPPGSGRMGLGGRGGPGAGMMGMGRTITGAPYSAVEVKETQQVLPNGNTISNRVQSNIYRDSAGRVRTETTVTTPDPATDQPVATTRINIHDPVAGVSRTLDTRAKTAYEFSLTPFARPAMQGRRPGSRAAFANRIPPTDPNTVTEELAMQTINGVQANGTRVTRTIPAGQIGNAGPIQIVHETWMSADLRVPVMTKITDPRSGTSTTQLTNITRAEPDPALFQVPSEYTVTRAGRGPGLMGGGPGGRIR